MNNNKEDKEWLYGKMRNSGVNISYEDFEKTLGNEEDRKWYYDKAHKMGLQVGSYDDFSRMFSQSSSGKPESVAQQVIDEYDASIGNMGVQAQQTQHNVQPQQVQRKPMPDDGSQFEPALQVPDWTTQHQKAIENIATSGTATPATDEAGQPVYPIKPHEVVYDEALQELRKNMPQPLNVQLKSLQDDVSVLKDDNRKKLKRYAGSGSNAMNALMGSSLYMQESKEDRQEAGALDAAGRLLEESQEIVDEAGKKGKTNFVSGLLRGIRDNAFDAEQWTFGLADMADSAYLLRAVQKAEKGEELTPAEEKLLDASVMNMAVNAYYGEMLGRGYKAGNVTAKSLPFMLEFVVNPVSSSGSAIAKNLLKYGMKKFGGKAVNRAVPRIAARLAGDTAAAAAMTGTTGAARVAADAMDRLAGNYEYGRDEDGQMRVEKTGDMSVGEAAARGFGSTLLENQSEMIFNAFKAGGKLAREAAGRSVSMFGGLADNELVKAVKRLRNAPMARELRQRTQIGGVFEEYGEEVYNNLASVATGDMSAEDALSVDTNIDTFLGLVPTQLAFSAIGLGGLVRENVSARKRLRDFTGRLSEDERELFDELHEAIRGGDADIPREFIKVTLADDRLSDEQKKERVFAVKDMLTEKKAEDLQTEAEAQEQEEPAMSSDEIQAGKVDTYRRWVRAQRRVSSFGIPQESLDGMTLTQLADNYDLDDKQVQAVAEYKDAQQQFGQYEADFNARLEAERQRAEQQARADVDRLGNKDTGMVTQASYKFSEKPVYVTGGTLAFAEDGTLDRDNSSDTVYYLGEDGKTHMAPASEFDGIVSSTPAENVVTQQAYDAETAFKQAEQVSLQSPDIPVPEKGVTFNLNGANYVIERPTPDGGLLAYKLDEAGEIDMANGNVFELSEEDYYNAKEAELWGTTLESVDNVLEVNPENANAPSGGDSNVSVREPEQTERSSEIVSGRSPQEDMPKYAQGDANVVLSSGQQLADLVATLPKKKTGELDYRSMTPQQQYDYTRLTESPEVAAEDLKADVEAKRAEIEKMKQQLAKATGGQRAELRDKVRGADKELAELEDFLRSVAPAREQAEPHDQHPSTSATPPADLADDEEYMDWVAENSEDPSEAAAAYRSAKEAASHESNLRPWQQQLLGMKISTSSFNRFGDRNHVTGALAKGWLRKDGRQLDTLAQELSLLGEEVTEQDIVNFMLQNPSNHVSQRSEIMRKLAARFSEIASAEMGFPVGGPDSNTGRLYLSLKEANQKLADLNEQQKHEVRQAIADDMLDNDRQGKSVEEDITEDYAAAYDEAMRQTDEEDADALLVAQMEEQGEPLYEGMTADELDEIYSSLTYTNYGTERQTAGSAENSAEPLQERTGESETPDDGEDIPAVDREDGEADSGTEQSETGTEALTSEGNSVPLQRNQTEEDNERTEVESLSGESGGLDGENETEAYLRRAGDRTAASDGRSRWTKESLLRDVVQRNKGNQTWIEDIQSITGKHLLRGGENDVYLSRDGNYAIKVNDFSYLPDNSTNFDSFMNRVDAHNELFPNDAITILGFTLNSDGNVSVVLSQPYISNAREATQEEIENFLEDMDFYTDMSGNWTDGIYEIADTKPNNVLVDEDGNLHFIDVLPYDTRKPGKMLEIPRNRDAFQAPAIERGENIFDYAERVAKAKETDDMRRSVNTNPTDAQKEAGNYKKGHVKLDGYNITIENPKGSTRSGRDAQGNEWSVTMQNDYGYIRGTRAVDGDHIDVFLSDTPEQGNVYVIDQIDQQTGEFDESKVMYGFNSMEDARDAYLSNYSTGWKVGPITEVSKDEFKKWIDSSTEKRKAFSEYKSVKAEAGQNQGQSTQSVNPSGNRLVTDERYAELKERMRKKLGGQLNVGIDPEILAIGTEMAVYHIEKGARKFADYAKAMIEDLGDVIRPYLKAFYNGARELPEVEEAGLSSELTPYEEVRKFDTANLGKTVMDVLAMAQTIADEQTIEKQADEVKGQINEGRAKKRKSSSSKSAKKTISSQKEIVNDLFNQNQQEDEPRNQTENRSLGGEAREENRGTGSRGESSGVHGRNVPDQDGSRGIHGGTGTERPVNPKQNTRNFRFGESGIDVPSGEIGKLKANIEAIRTLKEIEKSGEPATQEQKSKLSRYVGWGGLANALDENEYRRQKSLLDRYGDESRFYTPWGEKFYKYHKELKQLLTPEEFRSAIGSTTTSHYTPQEIIQALWAIVQRAGFKGGTVSEPALGIGHILGFMPENLSENSNISGFELDTLSGRIASALYPDARIKVQGYETEFAPQSKDLVITNVPFAKEAPYDKTLDKAFRKKLGSSYNLHNYFILKSLLELKEGGLGVFITSSSTMDGVDSRFREYISGNGIDLVGAIRLPNDAFQKNAGTSVTADILVFRKRKPGEPGNGIRFTSTTQIGEGSYEENGETRNKPIMVNEYFAEHQDMMLGEMMTAHDAGSGGLYSGASQTLKAKAGTDLVKVLREAVEKLPEGVFADSAEGVKQSKREQTDMKNGQLVAKDGKVFVSENGELVPIASKDFKYNGQTRKMADAVDDYNKIKSTLKELISEEQEPDGKPEPLRKKLNELYDNFVSKYGTLNRNKALDDVLSEDVEHNLPLSLETVKRVPSPTGKSMVYVVEKAEGILSKRISYPIHEPEKAESLQDAINISQSYHGSMDVPYISRLLGISEEETTDRLLEEGAAYRDPVTGKLQDKDSYLSGNVREKLEVAIASAENNPEYQKNVEDLTEVQPETVRFGDISFRLGTPWIPTEHVNKFAEDVLGITDADVSYMPSLNEFVLGKRARVTDFAKSGMFRTDRMGVIDLFDAAINQRKPKIYDEHTEYGPNGKTTIRVPNEAETQAVSEKIMEISDKFTEYIESRKDLHRELERIYNDRYNNYRLKEYRLPVFAKVEKNNNGKDVTIIHYPNSNIEISLREHQAKAVQRSLSESTLLAHQVGTGKTFTMITTAMEMRRLGIARKPMIVVQNATLEDFVRDFYKLYPGANVLAPSKDERSAENRKRLFNLIATGDFDAIVIPQSFLQFIPDDEGRKKQLIQKRIDELEDVLSNIEEYGLRKRLEREIEGLRDSFEGVEKKRKVKDKAKASARIKAKMERQLDRRTDDVMTFEQMGIDALFIDEAHNFKKIGFATKMNNVKGVDSSASQRANSLLLKAKWIQEKNGGRNVILATGTPITNTMAEVWTMMNFVAPEILDAYQINSFDDFATTFGTVEPSLEFTATGNFKIADRFKSYVNVPELVKAFRSHTDVVLTEDVKEFKEKNNIPKLKDGKMTNIVIGKNEDLEDVMQTLINRLEAYNNMSGEEKRKWSALPLVVFTKAKQAAIDLRLLNPSYPDNPNSKTNQVVNNIVKLYKESTPDKGTQLVFCDSYQSPGEEPKMDLFDYNPDVPRFNLYDDIREKLISQGIPVNEIAVVNNYDGERRKTLFEKVRNGDVRVLLGSTEKMGVGVNVQDRLYALHHIDAPIRPMDFEQRNGRILRQGNLYAVWGKPVNVVTYGVQGTLDATAYDRLRIKQAFINQMMKGDVSGRIMEEQDEDDPSGMTFSQMAATLSGDKTAQLLFAAQNKLKRLRNLKRTDANSKSSMGDAVESARNRIILLESKKKVYERAYSIVEKFFPEGVTDVNVNGRTITDKIGSELDEIISAYDDKYSLNRGLAPLKISLNKGNAEVVVHYIEGRMVYELYAGGEHVVEGRQFNGGRGLISSIDHQLKATQKNLDETNSSIEELHKRISGLMEAMSAPWGREEELKEAEREVENLQKQLEEKAADNSKKKETQKSQEDVRFRKGEGTYSNEDLSMANDPTSKLLGKSTRTAEQSKAFAERERRRMVGRARSLTEQLGLDNVEIVTDVSTLEGRKARAKGFFDPKTGKITIVIPNHTNSFDVEQTLLHESVVHYGLRRLFGRHFDTFLDNVYNNASQEVKERIDSLVEKYNGDVRTATEEYLASLAENTDFENAVRSGWFEKIKQFFLRMLAKAGIELPSLTDNELRYILWRSYENLAHPGHYRNVLDTAEDVAKQYELKVGNYAEPATVGSVAASESVQGLKAERIEKLRNSKPVEITGEEYKGKYELNRDSAKQWIKDNLHGEYTNKDTGEKIEIRKDGAQKVTSHSMGSEAHLKSLVAIPQMIENSVFIEDRPNEKDNDEYDRYRYYVCGLKIGDVDYTAKITVGVKGASKYYDHSLTKIEKGTLIDNIDALSTTFDNNQNALVSGIKDTELLSILQENGEKDAGILYRENGEVDTDGTIQAYEDALQTWKFKAREAYQDSMLALKELQNVVERNSGEKLKSFENAYMAENQMSSKSTREAEVYGNKFFKPMLKAVSDLMDNGLTYDVVKRYVMAKHGLERNEVFARRDAVQTSEEEYLPLYKEAEKKYKEGELSEEQYKERLSELDQLRQAKEDAEYNKNRKGDYSGLSSLMQGEEDYETAASEFVEEFEKDNDVAELWNAINDATGQTLKKFYESGMMSKKTYDRVKSQFKYYVPLRGWNEETAEDVYEYLASETSPVNSVLKTAKGRTSIADDPFAVIGNMAESTILQGNRNLMKQNFLNMAINHPSELLTVGNVWYVQDLSTGEWAISMPDIREGDRPEEISAKMDEHKKRMNELSKEGMAQKKRGTLNINYRIGKRQANEHAVIVKQNGEDYVIYVNGNPRAAQAVNGMTNPDVEGNKVFESISRFNRWMAANFTTRNPAFVLSNLSRDLIFSMSAVAVKEDSAYAKAFAKNIPSTMKAIAKGLNGKDAKTETDRYFQEFLDNGGETGYTALHNIDEYKRMIGKELKRMSGKTDYLKAVRTAGEWFGNMNRWAEDVARFNAYRTSRQMGRSITDAVNDAKEITVNFNKKGSGYKTGGLFGFTAGVSRNLYLFFNAAVQSLNNFSKLSRKNRFGFLTLLGGFASAGFLVPLLNEILMSAAGDDEDYYANLPEWTRRNNLCLYIGGGRFLTVPLPIELRAFYGLGEMAYQATAGKDKYASENVAYAAINQITELLPINPLGNNGDLVTTYMPDALKPFWSIHTNKDFTGKPIYRKNAFNEKMPEHTKAYKSTADWLVGLSEWTNELAGGNKYRRAKYLEPVVNWNPAKVEYLFESYFGGMATTVNQTGKTLAGLVKTSIDGNFTENVQTRSVPVLNRFLNNASDDRSRFANINNLYYSYYDLYEDVAKDYRGYNNEVARGNFEYLEELKNLIESDEFKVYQIFKSGKAQIDKINKAEKSLPEASEKERKELEKMAADLKQNVVDRIQDELNKR